MIKESTHKAPAYIIKLSAYRQERFNELLFVMNNNKLVSGILLGGSLSYKEDFAKSDIDLFCLVYDAVYFEKNLKENLSQLSDIDEIVFQGNFPWTEKLYTIYFKRDIDFSIDLCLIDFKNANTFFWEPDGCILFDRQKTITGCRTAQMNAPGFTRQPFLRPNPFCLSVVTLKKIEKNISRNHLWNALEQLNGLRRYIMQVIRLNIIKHDRFLGRVDRDIEDIIPAETNDALQQTVAIYDAKDIARKAAMLVEILLRLEDILDQSNEKCFRGWILKQLLHEKNKLSTYCQQ